MVMSGRRLMVSMHGMLYAAWLRACLAGLVGLLVVVGGSGAG
jgi:hypothetical protein